eukprot:scaffold50976_cov20-Tisochrysis_lutea.AAC.5
MRTLLCTHSVHSTVCPYLHTLIQHDMWSPLSHLFDPCWAHCICHGSRGGGGLAVRMDTLRLAAQALTPPHRVQELPAAGTTGAGGAATVTGLGAADTATGTVGLEATEGERVEGGGEREGGDHEQTEGEEEEDLGRVVHQPEKRLPHWAQQGVWHAGAPPWGQSWACLPPRYGSLSTCYSVLWFTQWGPSRCKSRCAHGLGILCVTVARKHTWPQCKQRCL